MIIIVNQLCRASTVLALALLAVSGGAAYQPSSSKSIKSSNRRAFLTSAAAATGIGAAVTTTTALSPAWALDVDAFINKELAASSSSEDSSTGSCNDKVNKKCMPKMTEDEALCRFGSPSRTTGEACLRAGMSTKRRGGGSLDAFGNVDRGEFVRCKFVYELNDKNVYEKLTVCSDGTKR